MQFKQLLLAKGDVGRVAGVGCQLQIQCFSLINCNLIKTFDYILLMYSESSKLHFIHRDACIKVLDTILSNSMKSLF